MTYIYLILLMFMFCILYKGISIAVKTAFKVRVIANIALAGLLVRNIALFIMFLCQNIRYLYMLKPFIFLDLACIPILISILIYILARNNKMNFSYLFIISIILFCIYAIFMFKFDYTIFIYQNFGYNMEFLNQNYILIFLLCIYSIYLFLAIILMKHKNTRKTIMCFVIVICIVSILEIILRLSNINLIPNFIISQCLWILIVDYVLYKMKKTRSIR
ncbi:hypothetical protein ACFIJ5_03065 [Haloimpatiens sp. FM7330]|uniref:hypothetical protein n=1 Tax=Haloimpatiens sp. FM7330 TaxID=3298610 RepID=UPI00363D23D2